MYIMHGTLKIHHFFSHTQYFQSLPSLYLILGLSTGRGLVTESLSLWRTDDCNGSVWVCLTPPPTSSVSGQTHLQNNKNNNKPWAMT